MPTLALSMITNDADATIKILEKYGQYFDKWFITVADKNEKHYNQLHEWFKKNESSDKLYLSFFKWENNFGKAREFNRQQIDTDFWFWLDGDDEIENPENIKNLLITMENQGLDCIYLRYDYAHNDVDEGIADHWRERMIRTAWGQWAQTRVHETMIAPNANSARNDEVTIIHKKTKEDSLKSIERNHKLLMMDWEDTKDPRTAHYLGLSYMNQKQYDEAIKMFLEHIKESGWNEERYRSLLKIAEIEYLRGDYMSAMQAADAATHEMPSYPDAYFLKGIIYAERNEDSKAIEWVKVGLSKPQPETLSIVDPTLFEYRGLFLAALSYLKIGKVKEAWQFYNEVLRRSPDYPLAKEYQKLFEDAYYDDKALGYTKYLMYYLASSGGDPVRLLNALPGRLVADVRLNAERAKFLPLQTWLEGSVAIMCGPAGENWGPDTLEKGMGGSEEAIVYLSRELAKQGLSVTVFNDREEAYQDTNAIEGTSPDGKQYIVNYKPWTLFNYNDTFNTVVVWRAPENARGINARKILVDLHDTIEAERVYLAAENKKITFMVKSQYHRDLYPDLPDERFVIVGNGIKKEQFSAHPIKNRYSVGYYSSYDRGLECLLDMWPKIREEVPEATLDIAYGWNTFDAIWADNPRMMKWKFDMQRKMRQDGVTEHGRLSHEELAKLMESVEVWAYPTEFTEIHCITALKAQEARNFPVTTNVAALKETVQSGVQIATRTIYGDGYKQGKFVEAVVKALKDGAPGTPVENCDWSDVAKVWKEALA